jgi:hypothetical protein
MHSYLNNLIGHKFFFLQSYAQAYEATYYLLERAGLLDGGLC